MRFQSGGFQEYRINSLIDRGEDTAILTLDGRMEGRPGQFVLITREDISGEKPFSVAKYDPLTFAIKSVGPFTDAMRRSNIGDRVMIRGPYGNGFPIEDFKENVWLVGGGVGVAPLLSLAHALREGRGDNLEIESYLGFRKAEQALFLREFSSMGPTYVSTDDDSYRDIEDVDWIKGWVINHFIGKLPDSPEEYPLSIALCGNERLMEQVLTILVDHAYSKDIFASVERMMCCGCGTCGNCEIDGFTSCGDGPVFSFEKLYGLIDFGRYHRDEYSRKVPNNGYER